MFRVVHLYFTWELTLWMVHAVFRDLFLILLLVEPGATLVPPSQCLRRGLPRRGHPLLRKVLRRRSGGRRGEVGNLMRHFFTNRKSYIILAISLAITCLMFYVPFLAKHYSFWDGFYTHPFPSDFTPILHDFTNTKTNTMNCRLGLPISNFF